jgi:hypothetical protein
LTFTILKINFDTFFKILYFSQGFLTFYLVGRIQRHRDGRVGRGRLQGLLSPAKKLECGSHFSPVKQDEASYKRLVTPKAFDGA